MKDLITRFVEMQESFFKTLRQRLTSFDAEQKNHPAAASIYAVWHDAYTRGRSALVPFNAICTALLAGQTELAANAYQIAYKQSVPDRQDPRTIFLALVNEHLPSNYFSLWIQHHNRALIEATAKLRRSLPPTTEADHDLDWIGAWIATFPHPETESPASEGGSLWGYLGAGLGGFLTGYFLHD